MTIILTQAVRIAGTTQPIGTTLTLEGGAEGDLVHRGCATYVTDPHLGQGDMTVRANINTVTGGITGIKGPDGLVASSVQVFSGERRASGATIVDWADATLGSPTAGWTVSKDTQTLWGGKTTLSVTATAGAADTMTCSITVPATFFGGAKRIACAIRAGDSYIAADGNNPVQLWLNYSGSTTHRMMSYAYTNLAVGDWSEGVLFDQDAAGSGHITGTAQWAKVAAEAVTTITLVMTKRAGQAISSAVNIGPIYSDPIHPATLTLFMDGQYDGQWKYARQILQSYNLKASLAVIPAWINDYPTVGAGAYPNTMTQAQMLAMYDLGHELIHHTGTCGPSGHVNVGWDDTTKYPDETVYEGVLADVSASQAWMRSVGATRGLGYGVVGFTNGLTNTQTLARRTLISQALRDAGMLKIRQLSPYLGSYYGCADEQDMVVTQSLMTTAAVSTATVTGVVDQIVARGGWSGLTYHGFALSGATGNDRDVAVFEADMDYIAGKVAAGTLQVKLFSQAMREIGGIGSPI